jgi:hypothetical protein
VKGAARPGPTDDDLHSFAVERRWFFAAAGTIAAAWGAGVLVAPPAFVAVLAALSTLVPVWGYGLCGRGRWARQATGAIALCAWLSPLLAAGAAGCILLRA